MNLAGVVQLHNAGHLDAAEQGYRSLISQDSNNVTAIANLALICVLSGRLDEGIQLLQRAIELNPGNSEYHLNLGYALKCKLDHHAAIECWRKALNLKPDYPEAYLNMGVVHIELGDLGSAADSYRKALEIRPDYAPAHYNLGNVFMGQGMKEEAAACFQRAMQLDPGNPEVYLNLGNILGSKPEEAVAYYWKAVEINPSYVQAYLNLGNAYTALGEFDRAVELHQKAIELRPDYAEAYNNLGVTLKELRKVNEAIAAFHKALEINPDYPEAFVNLGQASKDLGKLDESIVYYQKAIDLRPENASVYSNLGSALAAIGRLDDAITSYNKAVEIKTAKFGQGSTIRRLAELLYRFDRFPIIYKDAADLERYRKDYIASIEEASSLLSKKPEFTTEESAILREILFTTTNFYLAYQQFNDKELQKSYSRLVSQILLPEIKDYLSPIQEGQSSSGTRIRLGIASEYLRNHNGSVWAYGWLSNLPKDDYEFFFYSLNGTTDVVTDKFAQLGTFRWLPFKEPTYLRSLKRIREDNLDILLLPDVGMTASSKIISQMRLAPIQCVGWGHPLTTGSPNIDYYLSGELMETEESDDHYSEKLIRLPKTGVHFSYPEVPSDAGSVADFDIPEGRVVYGALQSLFKYLPQFDFIYPEIAQRVPDALFVFAGTNSDTVPEMLAERLRNCFDQYGLSFEKHVKILPRMSLTKFMQLLGVIDIYLDSIGFSGGMTAVRAIAMNCPVVTVPTELMRGRLAYAVVKRIGLDEMIADSVEEYIDISCRLGQDRDLRVVLSDKINSQKHRVFDDLECVEFLDKFFKSEARRIRECSPAPQTKEGLEQYHLGLALHRQGKLKEAIACYRKSAEIDPSNAQTYNDLAVALCAEGLYEEAIRCLQKTLELKPDFPEAYLNLGVAYGALCNWEKAISSYRKSLELNPQYAEAHYNLGNTYRAQGNPQEAIPCYQKTVSLKPDYVNAYLNWGNALQQLQNPEEAVACYQKVVELQPNFAQGHLNLGIALYGLWKLDESISTLQKALELCPTYAEAYTSLGLIYGAKGQWDDAASWHQLAIDLKPDYAEAYSNLGTALQAQQKIDDAVSLYTKAILFAPGNGKFHNNLGSALLAQHKADEAAAAFRKAIELEPNDSESYYNLGMVLQSQDKLDEAMDVYHRALEIRTSGLKSNIAREIGKLLNELHRIPVIYKDVTELEFYKNHYDSCMEKAVALVDANSASLTVEERKILKDLVFKINNFYLGYQQRDDKELQISYCKLASKILEPEIENYLLPPEAPQSGANIRSKIRLGIASQYLQSHNGAYWAYGWLQNLPEHDYEFFSYSLQGKTDWFTEKFANLGTYRWLPFDQNTYLDTFAAIKKDRLDVLLLPDVGMSVASRIISLVRLAPIQCVGWGHTVSTGSPAVDYFLSGELMETEEADSHYSETLVRLPNVGLYLEHPEVPTGGASRSDFGIPQDAIVYGCLQSLFKYLPQFDFLYPAIAREVSGALFIFARNQSEYITESFIRRLEQAFDRAGLSYERHVKILPRMPFPRFMQLLSVVDANLDSIGWNGGTTTMRSLYMSCPVVTSPTELMRGRTSTAMLKMVGLDELIANSLDEYIALACRLGLDTNFRASIVKKLESQKLRLFLDKQCVECLDKFLKTKVSELRS